MAVKSTTQNQYLTALASVLSKAKIEDQSSLDKVISQAAEEVAKGDPSVAASDLFELVPASWKDLSDNRSQSEAAAFLKVAGPVLGVDVGALSPVVTRGLDLAKNNDVLITVNRARMASADTPAQSAILDFSPGNAIEVCDNLLALTKDKAFLDRMGGDKYASQVVHMLKKEVAMNIANAVPPGANAYPPVVVRTQIRPVEPKKVQIAIGKMPMTAARVAEAALLALTARDLLSEVDHRGILEGKPVNFASGRVPYEAIHLSVRLEGDSLAIDLELDDKKLRKFHTTDSTAQEIADRYEAVLQAVNNGLRSSMKQGVPLMVAADKKVDVKSLPGVPG